MCGNARVTLTSMAPSSAPSNGSLNEFVLNVTCDDTGASYAIQRALVDFRDLSRASRRSPLAHLLPPFPPQKKLMKMAAASANDEHHGGMRPFREHTLTTSLVNAWLDACARSPAVEETWWHIFVRRDDDDRSCKGDMAMMGRNYDDVHVDDDDDDDGHDGDQQQVIGGPDNSSIRRRSSAAADETDRRAHQAARARARSLNQYFTRPEEAKLLVTSALDIAAAFGLLCPDDSPGASASSATDSLVLIDPSAGDGAIFNQFPSAVSSRSDKEGYGHSPISTRRIGIELDGHYAQKHGFVHGDFLQVTNQSLGLGDHVSKSRVVVIMNPPFVAHGSDGIHQVPSKELHGPFGIDESATVSRVADGGSGSVCSSNGRTGSSSRDATLAARFVAHALEELSDLVVALLPARFAREEQRELVGSSCAGGRSPHYSWVVGGVMKRSRFDLAGHMKEITQPSVIVVFSTNKPPESLLPSTMAADEQQSR